MAGALSYTQRALTIDEKVYGPDHHEVATDANNIGQILKAQGDLAGALRYTQRALKILQATFGPDHPLTKRAARNLASIQHALRT
jgi:tetratricopeptide (TPR) repeat protein